MPLVSVIADVPAVKTSPTAVLPVLVGWPVAALFVGVVAVAVVPVAGESLGVSFVVGEGHSYLDGVVLVCADQDVG